VKAQKKKAAKKIAEKAKAATAKKETKTEASVYKKFYEKTLHKADKADEKIGLEVKAELKKAKKDKKEKKEKKWESDPFSKKALHLAEKVKHAACTATELKEFVNTRDNKVEVIMD